ncbi:MAG: ATP synthase F1 subunit epsilon [Hespellia sp.]|jgi:F-type H+-transporting ATPase subunit epsilon|nr:ATP synthase F1 subunit epsilon [Hespellia sp.]
MAENTFELKIISPDTMFYEGKAEFLEFTATTGEMGVYAQHVPTTVILEPCVMRIHQNGELKKAAIMGGFVEILKERITVMAEDAQWPDSIDVERAKKAEERARKRLADRESDMDVKRAEMALKRSIARIETTR